MGDTSSRPVATPAYSVVQSAPHQFLVCKGCKQTDRHRRPGAAMMANLRSAIAAADLSSQFEVTADDQIVGMDHKPHDQSGPFGDDVSRTPPRKKIAKGTRAPRIQLSRVGLLRTVYVWTATATT